MVQVVAPPLRVAYIDNGIEGLAKAFQNREEPFYTPLTVTRDFNPDLTDTDVLVVPNGSDHIAMAKIADRVADFVAAGGALFCFDGWFTDWVPGYRWVADPDTPTAEVRYRLGEDPAGLFDQINLDDFIFMEGISGWWACGSIQATHNQPMPTLLHDSWRRAVAVWDTQTTPGLLFLTASGPLGEYGLDQGPGSLARLYHNALDAVRRRLAAAACRSEA
ncbi:hypothetical protein [Acanthopleuribacter pedis]|uniref:Glutamine amidotransferase domain-containing protein n=1 Tax=Acanthopleuribacter pedis TaxID=442870 RepID=A0A8J7Q8B5_9BACT|nr:hypothetical protein [Acanthopleuribacter pedis]MBO1319905.1 hypothetical protein [Acanthopleuribacter pedis]